MENMVFSRQNQDFKADKLRTVILSKISDVSEENVQIICRKIDLNRQYYVKATRNPKRFLNLIVEENVERTNESQQSRCSFIYGNYIPSFFFEHNGVRRAREGWIDETLPAAAVKTVVTAEKTENFLIIFEPMISSCVQVN